MLYHNIPPPPPRPVDTNYEVLRKNSFDILAWVWMANVDEMKENVNCLLLYREEWREVYRREKRHLKSQEISYSTD
jgi:hypothetical protein